MSLPPTLSPAQQVAARARRLASYGYLALIGAALFFWYNSVWTNPLITFAGIGIFVLGVLPVLLWLQRNDQAYPLPELMQFTLVPFYAVPLLTAHEEVIRYSESTLLDAASLVLLFQVLCLFGSIMVDRNYLRPRTTPWWSKDLLGEDNLRFSVYTLVLTTIWLAVTNFTRIIPGELTGTLRAIFFGIGTISSFIQARMWGSGHLNQTNKAIFVVNFVLQFILMNLSLVLVTSMITFLLMLVGYFSSARRLPLLVCALALPAFAVLHSGKHKMRDLYWGENGHDVTVTEVPAFYSEWIGYGLASGLKLANEEDQAKKRSTLFERASLIQLVCYAVETVPDHTPYLMGDSYSYVLPQVIPRFLWPGKPSPNDSVKLLSVRMGVLSADQAETTSIGYGLITEAYANFGYFGPPLLGFAIGWALRKVARATVDCGTLSIGGIFRILVLAWCLNTETTMAVWLSSFYQACIAVFFPVMFYNSFVK